VGATPPKDSTDGILRRKDTFSLDTLRKQLLGKHAGSRMQTPNQSQNVLSAQARPATSKSTQPDSSDEEESGRSAAFTLKRRAGKYQDGGIRTGEESNTKEEKVPESEADNSDDQDVAAQSLPSRPATQSRSKRKASSFLDELLAEKSKKKRKKKKKNHPTEPA